MSATEIMAELPKLTRPELEAVGARLHELLCRDGLAAGRHWGQALGEFAGTVEELPADYAANHDHYLHGAPKR
ncbi:MAG: hypothetical protein HY736_11680 [Verrucomicrobia bacterium]|nr:hypothetical protein [Verrucomicrobiota bacterium]